MLGPETRRRFSKFSSPAPEALTTSTPLTIRGKNSSTRFRSCIVVAADGRQSRARGWAVEDLRRGNRTSWSRRVTRYAPTSTILVNIVTDDAEWEGSKPESADQLTSRVRHEDHALVLARGAAVPALTRRGPWYRVGGRSPGPTKPSRTRIFGRTRWNQKSVSSGQLARE